MRDQSKYKAVPTIIDGTRFDSKKEGRRYGELKLLVEAGQIRDLVVDKKLLHYPLVVNGVKIGIYTPDSRYFDVAKDVVIVEDAKGVRTRDYILRKKLMLAIHGIDIYET